MYKIGSKCAIYGCCNYKQQKESKSFFRIPKDKDLLTKWIVACNRKYMDELLKIKEPDYFYRTYSICSDHFEMQCFRNKKLFSQGLVPGSVPTLLLHNAQIETERKNRYEIVCQERCPKKMQTVIDDATETSINEASTSYSRNESTQTAGTQFEMLRQENSKLKLKMKEYQKKLQNKACLVWKYKKENRLLKQKLAQLSEQRKTAQSLGNGMSQVCEQFSIDSQLRLTNKHKMGRRVLDCMLSPEVKQAELEDVKFNLEDSHHSIDIKEENDAE